MTKARELYKKSCDGDLAVGCSYWGDMFEYGKGGAKDLTRAKALYKQGCDAGDSWGCDALEDLE